MHRIAAEKGVRSQYFVENLANWHFSLVLWVWRLDFASVGAWSSYWSNTPERATTFANAQCIISDSSALVVFLVENDRACCCSVSWDPLVFSVERDIFCDLCVLVRISKLALFHSIFIDDGTPRLPFPLRIQLSLTVLRLKQMIEAQEGFSVDEQEVFFQGIRVRSQVPKSLCKSMHKSQLGRMVVTLLQACPFVQRLFLFWHVSELSGLIQGGKRFLLWVPCKLLKKQWTIIISRLHSLHVRQSPRKNARNKSLLCLWNVHRELKRIYCIEA